MPTPIEIARRYAADLLYEKTIACLQDKSTGLSQQEAAMLFSLHQRLRAFNREDTRCLWPETGGHDADGVKLLGSYHGPGPDDHAVPL